METKRRRQKNARPQKDQMPHQEPRNLEPQAEQRGPQQIEESTRDVPRR